MIARIYIPNRGRWTDERWSRVVKRYWDASAGDCGDDSYEFKVDGELVRAWSDRTDFPCEVIRQIEFKPECVDEARPNLDQVNPSHYKRSIEALGVEVIDILEFFFPDDPLGWQVGKYALRAGHKESALTDWKKLVWYAQRKVKQLEVDG